MSQPSNQLAQEFAKYLSTHGYGFQYAVIKYIKDLIGSNQIVMIDDFWRFLMSEFPVKSEKGTRIDFVLERAARSRSYKRLFLVAECKRANPATANWCFVKSPYPHRGVWGSTEYVHLECVKKTVVSDAFGGLIAGGVKANSDRQAYHLAFSLRTNEKGDESGQGGRQNEIEDAMGQALRGSNGFVMHLDRYPHLLEDKEQVGILPVIFTTANLYTSDVKLDEAELATGKLTGGNLTREAWVMCQYSMSPGLKHTGISGNAPGDLVELYQIEYIRTVPVVSVDGIHNFMAWVSSLEFEMR